MKNIVQNKKIKLIQAADKVIRQLEATGLKQDHIALKANIDPATLSRFMNKKEGYITHSMVERMKLFLNPEDEKK